MKFAQYLRDTQIPEWKKAYIDYRGLKKRITAIREAQQGFDSLAEEADEIPPSDSYWNHASIYPLPSIVPPESRDSDVGSTTTEPEGQPETSTEIPSQKVWNTSRRASITQSLSNISSKIRHKSIFGTRVARLSNPSPALPLHDLLPQLSSQETLFFAMLDSQLDKVEAFYVSREEAMMDRGEMLKAQLRELDDHRRLFLEANNKIPWAHNLAATWKIKVNHPGKIVSERSKQQPRDDDTDEGNQQDKVNSAGGFALSPDPDNYLYAKRKLKKAVLEHYRGLEVLHNYRVLNITGFRKALKKFEKVTKIPVQNQYMTEKVDKSAFASDKAVTYMLKEMEDLFAISFAQGDKKRATMRLRGGTRVKSHHFNTFRSGIFLGLAVPALASGLFHSFQEQTRRDIPAWDALLFLYGIILVPMIFVLLVGLNLLVWSRSRINYVFIFELDVMNRLDFREYFEIPSILLAALCYTFWLSFARIGFPIVSPTIWPLVWIGFAALVVLQPFPLFFRSSRYWLVRNVSKLFLSGTRHVEFTDFWMGDQFCSMLFTLSNFYLFGCVYANDFSIDWRKCGGTSPRWPVSFVLTMLPFAIRVIQSFKRYAESGLVTHLINAGKYASGIVSYLFYFLWRHHGSNRDIFFILWCLFTSCSAIYSATWDLLMDWSLLRLHSPYPLLRNELIYSNHISLYYIAIISNVLLRFTWVWYIPTRGPDTYLRSFVLGLIEVIRRWQWNFYRLENEHIGNMDQYRVTRERLLPYNVDSNYGEDAEDLKPSYKK